MEVCPGFIRLAAVQKVLTFVLIHKKERRLSFLPLKGGLLLFAGTLNEISVPWRPPVKYKYLSLHPARFCRDFAAYSVTAGAAIAKPPLRDPPPSSTLTNGSKR